MLLNYQVLRLGVGTHNALRTNLIERGPKKEAEIPNEMSFLFNDFLLITKLQVCDPGLVNELMMIVQKQYCSKTQTCDFDCSTS